MKRLSFLLTILLPFSIIFSIIFSTMTLSGCASSQPEYIATNTADPLKNINSTASIIEKQMKLLAASSDSVNTAKLTSTQMQQQAFQTNMIPKGLDKPITIAHFVGNAEQAIAMITNLTRYSFKIYGKTPTEPIFVNITASDRLAYDVLQDINYQIGHQASINIYPLAKLITLTYPQSS